MRTFKFFIKWCGPKVWYIRSHAHETFGHPTRTSSSTRRREWIKGNYISKQLRYKVISFMITGSSLRRTSATPETDHIWIGWGWRSSSRGGVIVIISHVSLLFWGRKVTSLTCLWIRGRRCQRMSKLTNCRRIF